MTDIAEIGYKVDTSGLAAGSAALDNFAKQQDVVTNSANKMTAASGSATTATAAFTKLLQGIQGQMVALAGGLGLVGTFLAGLGPVGLAAAVGLGAIQSAFNYLNEGATHLGEKALDLQHFADAAGLTAIQLKTFEAAGLGVGVSTDRSAISVERFTVQLEQARQGLGPLYDTVLRINPALAQQLATTNSTAVALNILAAAYNQAGSAGAQLANSAFGRGGVQLGGVLSQIGNAGGIDSLNKSLTQTTGLTNEEVTRIAKLQEQIDILTAHTRTLMESTYAEAVLQRQLQAAQLSERIAQSVKATVDALNRGDISEAGLVQEADNAAAAKLGGRRFRQAQVDNGAGAQDPTITQRLTGLQLLKNAFTENDKLWSDQTKSLNALDVEIGKIGDSYGKTGLEAQLAANQNKAVISALGGAATSAELYRAKVLDLSAAQEKSGIPQSIIDRAKAYYATQLGAADLQIKVQNNVATSDELLIQKSNELNILVGQGKITQDQATASLRAYVKTVEDTVQQENVRKASLTQLKTLEGEASSLRNQLDVTATGTLNDFSNALVQIGSGAQTAGDAFKAFGLQVVQALEKMLIQMIIIAPIAKSLQSILGSFLPGGGALSLGSPGGTGGGFGGLHAGGGTIGANQWGIVGEKGPEIAVAGSSPLSIIPNAAVGGGGTQVQVNVINNASGTETKTQQRKQGGLSITDVIISEVNKGMANGRFDTTMKARFGNAVPAIPR